MNELTFYDFVNNKYLTTTYIINGTLSNYFGFLNNNNNNIDTQNSIFIHNFKIISNKLIIDNTFNNIVILEKDYFERNKIKSTNNTNNFTLDNKTDEYISLLQNNNDLISFIIILKTDKLDYIISYLEKYKKKPIYNIIKSNQQNIIDILTYINSFI